MRNPVSRTAAMMAVQGALLASCIAAYSPGQQVHGIRALQPLGLPADASGRALTLSISAPEGAGPFPLVVFSHGALCYPQKYGAVTDYWVRSGYVVIAPHHLDAPTFGRPDSADLPRLLGTRIEDMSRVLDRLDEIEAATGLAGRIDRARIAAAGHSFGGMVAAVKTGLFFTPEEAAATGQVVGPDRADARFRATVVMSGVGVMPPLTESSFAALTGPVFASGGTRDLGNTGGPEIHPWEWRLGAYALAPPGDKYAAAFEDADHYLGGLVCRDDRGGSPDRDAAAALARLQVAFLDGYLKGDRRARDWLARDDLPELLTARLMLRRR